MRYRPAVRCSARRTDGQPCRAFAIHGGTTCVKHGGSAPQVIAAAKRRLESMALAAAGRLGHFAFDDEVPPNVGLAAANSILDRNAIGTKQAVQVEVGVKPFEQIFTGIARGVGRDGKPAPTLPDPPALTEADDEPIDAEVVEMPAADAERDGDEQTGPGQGDTRKRPPPWQAWPMPTDRPKRKPSTALVTMEQANAELARDRRRGRA